MWVQITFGVIFVKLHIFWNGKKGQLLMILLVAKPVQCTGKTIKWV